MHVIIFDVRELHVHELVDIIEITYDSLFGYVEKRVLLLDQVVHRVIIQTTLFCKGNCIFSVETSADDGGKILPSFPNCMLQLTRVTSFHLETCTAIMFVVTLFPSD
jgi:hypothetical protein